MVVGSFSSDRKVRAFVGLSLRARAKLLLLRQRPRSELIGDADQLASECPKLIKERDDHRRHDEPLMGRMALNAQLLGNAKVTAANCVREDHARPKDMGHVGDGRQPSEL